MGPYLVSSPTVFQMGLLYMRTAMAGPGHQFSPLLLHSVDYRIKTLAAASIPVDDFLFLFFFLIINSFINYLEEKLIKQNELGVFMERVLFKQRSIHFILNSELAFKVK
jgi:hypothetical protein